MPLQDNNVIQKFGVGNIFLCFWKMSLMLTKTAFIW